MPTSTKVPSANMASSFLRRTSLIVGVLIALFASAAYVIYGGGRHQGPGLVNPNRVPPTVLEERAALQREAVRGLGLDERREGVILFGDLHSHTTFSADALFRSLPIFYGDGPHPPADACDFARFCSGLDFFGITDHAEALTPQQWRETKESIRQCNSTAGNPENPDVVAFAGWEWSQVGATPAQHYGHRTVLLRDDAEEMLPPRPIAAPGPARQALQDPGVSPWTLLEIPILEFPRRRIYLDTIAFLRETNAVPQCPPGVEPTQLSADCREFAATPAELVQRLSQWGEGWMVIPHGTAWGFYTPPGYVFESEVAAGQVVPEREPLIELFSGHGNSEEYRNWRAVEIDSGGQPQCPEPRDGYVPCCWRAGELIRTRCGDIPAEDCQRRVQEARANYLAVGIAGRLTVPWATVTDWGNCGQCTDCFLPAFQYRPAASIQRALAARNFKESQTPRRLLAGFIASSDSHSARPGSGYKEFARHRMTDTAGPRSQAWRDRILGKPSVPSAESVALTEQSVLRMPIFKVLDFERQASFFLTGGLVALHARDRTRAEIWSALQRREVYATSGDRILLWFDLLNGPSGVLPMGAETVMAVPPKFSVRAVGAAVERPGCPEDVAAVIDGAELERLCAGQCYHPGTGRRHVSRIEVVRIRPQRSPDEPIEGLTEDPWRSFDCPPDPAGCRADFEDPEFPEASREAIYYVRAVQEPTLAVDAGGLRCVGQKNCQPCYGDWRTPYDDDCLDPAEERAWSSPIFVRYAASSDAGRR